MQMMDEVDDLCRGQPDWIKMLQRIATHGSFRYVQNHDLRCANVMRR